jgi:hypothetical protein
MVDFIRIVNDAKVALVTEYEALEEQDVLDSAGQGRMYTVSAQIDILNKVHAEMLRQENLALDALYLAHRERVVAT